MDPPELVELELMVEFLSKLPLQELGSDPKSESDPLVLLFELFSSFTIDFLVLDRVISLLLSRMRIFNKACFPSSYSSK